MDIAELARENGLHSSIFSAPEKLVCGGPRLKHFLRLLWTEAGGGAHRERPSGTYTPASTAFQGRA